MKILDVIPIAKGIPHEKLSYFTSKDVSVGDLVSVPVRNKEISAVVDAVSDAKESKDELKRINFLMKPIKSVVSANFITTEFLEACKEIAEYYVSASGSVLKDFIPQAILENERKTQTTEKQNASPANNSFVESETMLAQFSEKDRIQFYKSVVREEFAKNKSVFLCLPVAIEIASLGLELQRGIEKYVYIFSGKTAKKKMIENWRKVSEEKHPVLIIATKSFFSVPRRDIGAIIVDNENSFAHKGLRIPYIDARKAAEIISKHLKTRLIFNDDQARVETFYRQESNEFAPAPLRHSRVVSSAEQFILDAKENFENIKPSQKRLISTPGMLKILDSAVNQKEKIVILTNRKGHSPITICADCQKAITCGKCDAPAILYKTETKTIIQRCSKCLSEAPAPERCPHCKGWRLESYGAGVQAIAEEMEEVFPETKVFEMDSDSIKNEKEGRQMAENFMSSGGILIGTEMIFSYINQPVDMTAAMSIDGLFTLPEFKINEKVFHLVLKLKLLAKKTFIIQTRFPEMTLFSRALKGDFFGFYKEEIENRKIFQYPPFKLLIKITKQNKDNNQLLKEIDSLQKILTEWNPMDYSAFIPKIKNLYIKHILLKIDPASWPARQEKLSRILCSLPPSYKVDIGPESLL